MSISTGDPMYLAHTHTFSLAHTLTHAHTHTFTLTRIHNCEYKIYICIHIYIQIYICTYHHITHVPSPGVRLVLSTQCQPRHFAVVILDLCAFFNHKRQIARILILVRNSFYRHFPQNYGVVRDEIRNPRQISILVRGNAHILLEMGT